MTVTCLDRTIEIKRRIEGRIARIGIVGMGYVGLPLALLFSEERFVVTGFDVDPRKVDTLNRSRSYIVRIPTSEIESARENGFSATADYSQIAEMDVVIICVPTPLNEYHEPDLSYVTGTV
ncbi:MAG: NAD(P)-binding domain-containing protein, partial [Formivibrio sp.]|nr:NAD(P)-binding domain-containing protein [Formivibrio sp.]